MASSYTFSFIPLTTVVVPRWSTSSPSFSLIPPPSLLGKKLMVTQPSRRCFVSKHRFLTSASTVFSVPTEQPENGSSSDKIPKWSARAIKSLAMGELEARKLKYPTTGTETHGYFSRRYKAQLLSSFLRGNGVTLFKVREEIIKLLGKSDMCGWTAYLLLGVWSQKDSAGRQILEALGFNEDKAKQVAVSCLSLVSDVDLSFKKQGQ
ncbi:unnamed protein product [Brassica oleracea]